MMHAPFPSRTAARRLLAAALLLLPAAACGGSGGGGSAGPGFQGALSVFEPDPTTLEAEPNDTLAQAHQLGDIRPGRDASVLGSISAAGNDQLDIFEFQAPERVTVDLALADVAGGAGDLDVFIYDPVSLQIVQQAASLSPSEATSFVAKGTFFVVVDVTGADASYELSLTGRPAAGFQEFEPNDTLAEANYLGTLALGEVVTVQADGADPGSDIYLFSIPAGQTLSFRLTATDPQGDYDVDLFDVTQGIGSAMFLERFDSGPPVESGQRAANPMSLYALEVFPFEPNDVSSYTLEIANGVLSLQGVTADPPARRRISKRSTAAVAAALTKDPVQLEGVFRAPGPVCRGDVIVRFEDERPSTARDIAQGLTRPMAVDPAQHLCKVRCEIGPELTEEEAARTALAVAATLRGMPGVVHAELDHRVQITALPQAEVFPNDTFYNLQWHYEQIGLPRAWGITTGSSAVRVAVLDTGTVAATDLTNAPGIDMISDPGIAGDGDGIDNDPTDVGDGVGPQPSSFHGAHVAGTIAANTDNGFGVAGVSWAATVFHVRVLGIGGGSSFDIAQGIRYAAGLSNASGQVANPPADIINMSLGGPGFNQTVQNACTAAHNAGSVVIAAAGNNNSDVPFFPAAYDDVISVSAVDFERRKAPYSNFHPTVDIAAPGGDVSVDRNNDNRPDGVLSTKPDDSVSPTNFNSFSFYQGTSMAAPHVAGVAALMLSVDPALTPNQVETILRSTSTDLGDPGRDPIFGEGLVNAFAAVQTANGGGGMANPILALDSASVLFDSRVDSLSIGVTNAGGGTLEVTSVVSTTTGPQGWLSAASVPAGQGGGPTDTSAIDISVSAGGLPDGVYVGNVAVISNAGSQNIAVTLALGQSAPSQNFEVFVIAVDADTLETRAQDVVFTGGSLLYSLDGLEPGRYLLVAGTDEDGDDLICDAGEPLCGFYPSLGLSTIIDLAEGERITGLNFPLQPVEGSAAGAAQAGFRLLGGEQ